MLWIGVGTAASPLILRLGAFMGRLGHVGALYFWTRGTYAIGVCLFQPGRVLNRVTRRPLHHRYFTHRCNVTWPHNGPLLLAANIDCSDCVLGALQR